MQIGKMEENLEEHSRHKTDKRLLHIPPSTLKKNLLKKLLRT